MEEAQEKERFEVTDLASAEWCMEKLAEKAAERQQVEEQYHKMIDRYNKWWQTNIDKLDSDEAYFRKLLRSWVADQLAGSKKKSISLPSGRVGFRAGSKEFMLNGDRVTSTNPSLLEFVKGADSSFIETKESVKWGEYKKTLKVADDGQVVTADGEIVPDMVVEQGEPTFYAEVSNNDAEVSKND